MFELTVSFSWDWLQSVTDDSTSRSGELPWNVDSMETLVQFCGNLGSIPWKLRHLIPSWHFLETTPSFLETTPSFLECLFTAAPLTISKIYKKTRPFWAMIQSSSNFILFISYRPLSAQDVSTISRSFLHLDKRYSTSTHFFKSLQMSNGFVSERSSDSIYPTSWPESSRCRTQIFHQREDFLRWLHEVWGRSSRFL